MGVKMFVLANAYYWHVAQLESPNGVRSGRQPGWDEPALFGTKLGLEGNGPIWVTAPGM